MRRVKSAEDLLRLHDRGAKFTCPSVSYMEKPMALKKLRNLSFGNVMGMINRGMFAVGEVESDDDWMVLNGRDSILALGMSYEKIAEKVGVSKQAVSRFLRSDNVESKTVKRYLVALELV